MRWMMAISDRFAAVKNATERMSYLVRKAPATRTAGANLVNAGVNFSQNTSDLGAAREQYDHFRGTAYSAISAIAKRCAGVPVYVGGPQSSASDKGGKLLTKGVGQDLEPIPDHPLIQAIDDPNELMVRWTLMYSTVASLEITGRSFWWLVSDGEKLKVWPLPASWVRPADTLRTSWLVRPAGSTQEFSLPGDNIAYFYLPDPGDPFGSISPLATQAASVNADESILTAQHKAMENGIYPGMAIIAGKEPTMNPGGGSSERRPQLTAEQRSQLINAMRAAYRGVLRNGEPIILDGLIEDVKKLTNTPAEMDFMASSKMTRNRIFQAFGVNPLIIGEIEGANRAQAVVAEESFCVNVINPLLALMGQVLTGWVGPKYIEGGKLKVWFEPCRAYDAEQRFKEWSVGAARGAVTVNEYRRNVLNLQDVPWGEVPMSQSAASSPASAAREEALKRLGLDDNFSPYTLRSLRRVKHHDE